MSNPAAARSVVLRYSRASGVHFDGKRSEVVVALDAARAAESSTTPPAIGGRVKDGALLRDALATLFAVRDSDLRYQGKDRSAYFAYLLSKGKRAGAGVWEAQKAFIDRELAGETAAAEGLDPLLTVDADEASFEVFSRDESAYARLSLGASLFDERRVQEGTAFFQLPSAFAEQVGRLRSYLPVHLDAAAGSAATAAAMPVERTAQITDVWLKSFLQVQSAATLPATTCEIAPVDLYNILYVLSVRRAKKAPRALRFELIPGKRPRIVIEPFGVVLETHGAPFTGRTPQVVRTYGRQRLLLLHRLLSHVERVRISLLGPGLPVFWVLDLATPSPSSVRSAARHAGHVEPNPASPTLATLTLALTGWTDASWSTAATFDRLVPSAGANALADRAVAALSGAGPLPLPALAKSLNVSADAARAALQRACLRGEVVFDVASAAFRLRRLFATPVNDDVTRAATPREVRALRLLETKGAVVITKEHTIAGQGLEVRGETTDAEARRVYTPRFTVDLEGRVTEAWCNCPTFARSALREGPCEHMLALRTTHAREQAAALAMRDTPEGRARIRAETRVLVRRNARGAEDSCRISLDGRRVRLLWTEAGAARHQTLDFDRDADAREEYFGRLASLAGKGFIDAGDLAVDAASSPSPVA
ncbi:MAG: SWIM zinc finger family protein [Polyangiaceae bacterium]|nr:SWIM zinc finger family protein [Polyangiaceae bacterium]